MVPLVEVAKNLAEAFGVTLDYLADDSGTEQIKDRTMLKRLIDIEALRPEDKKTVVHVIDSLLRDARARKIYAAQA
jgi:transcriptional regulator with XRE-family HTH domain